MASGAYVFKNRLAVQVELSDNLGNATILAYLSERVPRIRITLID